MKKSILALLFLLFTGIAFSQTTVTLQDQCNCEVLKGTDVSVSGATTPSGADLGDIYVNTNTGTIYFWDGDTWELTASDDQQLTGFTFDDATNILSLSLEDGGSLNVDLSSLQDVLTDSNTTVTSFDIDGTNTNLVITDSDANSYAVALADLAALIDTNTDSQDLTGATLSGSNQLQIDIQNGASTTADLSSLDDSAGVAANASDIADNTADITSNTGNISTNATNIATNTSDIANNITDISTNATNIAGNTSNIATNTSDIATNTADISTNTTDIATNASDIATNTTDIANHIAADGDLSSTNEIQNLGEVLADGNDGGGLAIANIADPTAAQDAATKAYVDSVSDDDITGASLDAPSNVLTISEGTTDVTVDLSDLDDSAGVAANASDIADNTADITSNTGNISTNATNIATNTTDIGTNASDITTNAGNISINATNIASNTADITTNASDIATNTTDIAANTADISTNAGNISTNATDISNHIAADGDLSSTNEIQNIEEVLTDGNDANGLVLTGLGTPTAASDAATKAYVDSVSDDDITGASLDAPSNVLTISEGTTDVTVDLSDLDDSAGVAANASDIADNTADITSNTGNISTNATNIAANTTDIGTNASDITTNAGNISINATNIASNTADITTNASDIATNTTDIAANTADISTNAGNISANATDIANHVAADGDLSSTNEIQNLGEVLADGNDGGGLTITNIADPTAAQDAATKAYVDSVSDDDITGASLDAPSNVLTISEGTTDVTVDLSDLDDSAGVAANASDIADNAADITSNTGNISTNATNIATNTTDIGTNASDITTNAGNISINATNIASNTADITTNASDIATNTTDIAANTADISTNAGNISANATDISNHIAADGDLSSTNEIQNIEEVLTDGNDANGLVLTGLGAPTAASDAATKAYVDSVSDDDITGASLDAPSNVLTISEGTTDVTVDLSDLDDSAGVAANASDIADNTADITSNTGNISTNATNIATNTSDIANNITDISTNATNIAGNTSNIATNTSDIATNTADISTNTTDIATNASDIATNTTDIANHIAADGDLSSTNEIQNLGEVLADGNDGGGLAITNIADPTAAQDAATKAYVDSVSDDDITGASLDAPSNVLTISEGTTDVTVDLSDLDDSAGVAANASDIADNTADITSNTGNISTNATNIATNTTDIGTNASDITTNAGNISTNATNIATNTSDISTNATDIANHIAADADTNIGNEYNTGSGITGGNLEITDGGGTESVNLISGDANNNITAGSDGALYLNVASVSIAETNTTLSFDGSTNQLSYTNEIGNNPVVDMSSLDDSAGVAANASDIADNAADITSNTGNISTNATNVATNTSDIAGNTADITTNTTNIATNTGNIATNTSDIATNTADISTNTTDIATNASDIATNTTDIANHIAADGDLSSTNEIQNIEEVLTDGNDANGLVLTGLGAPTAASDAATKAYVDSVSDDDITGASLDAPSNVLTISEGTTDVTVDLSDLDDSAGVAANASDIADNTADITSNTGNISTNATNIATNTTDIAGNTADIATNTTNIATNTTDIATNSTDIATNASDITTNAGNISTNATNIATNTSDISANATDIANHIAADADTNIGNEYNTGSGITGGNLEITDGGGTESVNLISSDANNNITAGSDGALYLNVASVSIAETNTTLSFDGSTNQLSYTNELGNNPVVDMSSLDDSAGVAANASDIADNTADITSNTGNISTNATNIATNTTDIGTNASDITTNAGNISTNATNIATNTSDISTNATDIANHIAADADTNIGNEYNTGSGITGGNLEITDGGGTESVNLISGDANNNITAGSDGALYLNVASVSIAETNTTLSFDGSTNQLSYTNEMGNNPAVDMSSLDDSAGVAANASDIADNTADITSNTGNISTNATNIATNTTDIGTNASDITTNAGNISINATNIASNTADITTNASDIATNTTDIAANTADISTNAGNISTNATDIANHIAADGDLSSTNEIQNLGEVLADGNDGGGLAIANIADPTAAQDAATKAYVDGVSDDDITGASLDAPSNVLTISEGATDVTVDLSDLDDSAGVAANASDIATNASDIGTNATNIATNTSDIAGNTADITSNTGNISTNATNIATNTSDIADNTADIITNTTNIATNTTDIANHIAADGDLSSTNEIQNIEEVLTDGNDANGLVLTGLGAPTAASDAATKAYVDSVSDDDITGASLDAPSNVLTISEGTTDVTVDLSDLDDSAGVAANASDIATNASDIGTNATNIATNTSDIAANTAAISTNSTDIATNASDITTNTGNISANATNIATNTSDISANATDISNHIAADGDLSSTNEIQNLGEVLADGNDGGGLAITNIADPTAAQDAATKAYVDSVSDDDITGASLDAPSNVLTISEGTTDVTVDLSDLDDSAGVAANASDIADNTADITSNTGDISTNATNIATNTTDIGTNASDITTNAGNISINATNIASNTADITTNASDIATNTTNITTNASDIATNTTDIATNVTNISANATDIANHIAADGDLSSTNEIQNLGEVLADGNDGGGLAITNIADPTAAQDAATKAYVDSVSDDDITGASLDAPSNVLTISEGTTDVTVDLSDLDDSAGVAANASDIADNAADITSNTGNISTNATNIATNTSDIADNTADITTNTTDIATNTADISTNAGNISANATDISNHIAADGDLSSTNEIQNLGEVLTDGNDGGGLAITNIADPIAAQDAATKAYVDSVSDDDITGASLDAPSNVLTISEGTTDVTVDLSDLDDSAGVAANASDIADNTADITSNTGNISTNATNIATNTSDIAGNTADITTNTTNIAGNTSNIATNTADITTNTTDIATNTADISTNAGNISANATDISNHIAADGDLSSTNEIQNLGEVLADGNDGGGLAITNIADPTTAQDAATKAYVDSVSDDDITGASLDAPSNVLTISEGTTDVTVDLSDLDDSAGVAANASDIADNTADITSNTGNISTNATNIATNTSDIAGNTSDIATNTTDIAANTAAISTNTGNISANATDIATNTTDISANATDISNHIAADGDLSSTNEINTRFEVNGTNLEIEDSNGTLQVPLTNINTDDQVASEVNSDSPIDVDGDGNTETTVEDVIQDIAPITSKAARIFYPPSIAIDASSNGTGRTVDLYAQYVAQYGTPSVASAGAPAAVPTYGATELYYYVTYAAPTVFDNMSIDANGVLTYDIIGQPADYNALINVVFVVK